MTYAKGCDINDGDESEIDKAVKAAQESDIAVVVLGESFDMSGEAKSRTELTLPDIQLKLLNAVIETRIPVVLLISAGRPIVVEDFREKVSALAYIWQLVTATGDAVVSVPRCVGQVPVYYNRPNTGKPYRGEVWYEMCYIDESIYPRYPFGYGLSYTDFEYSNLVLSDNVMSVDGSITVSCQVTNTGVRVGKTVVQLYVRDLVGSCVRPIKELKGFEKVSLEPGESCTVSFSLEAKDLSFHNEKLEKIIEPGKFHLWIGKDSDDEKLFAEFEVR